MNCPKCGYAMGPFDVECERCKRMGEPQPEPIPELLPQAPPPVEREAVDRAYQTEVDALQAQANLAGQLSSVSCLVGLLMLGGLVLLILFAR